MTITIDPQFSVFHLVDRVQLGNSVLNHRRTMSLVSYEIENATLTHGARNRIFAGFQVMSKFIPQIERYTSLAQRAESVYVFGVMDVQPPPLPHVTYVSLTQTDQLAKEWFLVSHGQDYFSALATEEVSHITDPDDQRVFKGLWTFDLSMVMILESWLTSAVDARPLQISDLEHNFSQQIRLMAATLGRFTARLSTDQSKSGTPTVDHPEEIGTLIDSTLKPAVDAAE